MKELTSPLAVKSFPHMLYHFVLTYSNWEHVKAGMFTFKRVKPRRSSPFVGLVLIGNDSKGVGGAFTMVLNHTSRWPSVVLVCLLLLTSCRRDNDLFDIHAHETTRSAVIVDVEYLYTALEDEKAVIAVEPLTPDGKPIAGGLWQSSAWISPGKGRSSINLDLQTTKSKQIQGITTSKMRVCIEAQRRGTVQSGRAVIFCKEFAYQKTWFPRQE